jgi:hypothetical protein
MTQRRPRFDDEEVQRRVRRFGVLRAAQRALREVTPADAFAQAEAEALRLLHRLRAITSREAAAAVEEPRQALTAIDARL